MRDRGLDGLRGIAVLMVIVLHTLHFDQFRPVFREINNLIKTGWMGVDLFFVLSGFLITRILLRTREDGHRTRNFYMRRALRILPAYWCYLALVFLLLWLTSDVDRRFADSLAWLPHLLIFTNNIHTSLSGATPPVRELAHLWSLAVEEQFYLVWPWLLWRVPTAALPRLCLLVIAVAWISKLVLVIAGAWWHAIYVLPFTRMDGFAIGAFLAVHHLRGNARLPAWVRPLPWIATALVVGQYLLKGKLHNMTPAETAVVTSTSVLMFGGLVHRALIAPEGSWLDRALGNRVLLFFGFYSYGLYLIHYGVDTTLRMYLQPAMMEYVTGNRMKLLLMATTVALSVLLAVLMHRLVEAPALRLKRYFEPEKARLSAAEDSAAAPPARP